MSRRMLLPLLILFMAASLMTGCSRSMLGGAAVGAGAAGAAYEYQNKRQMDMLEEDFESGRIDRDEYLRRKREIEKGSLIY